MHSPRHRVHSPASRQASDMFSRHSVAVTLALLTASCTAPVVHQPQGGSGRVATWSAPMLLRYAALFVDAEAVSYTHLTLPTID
jgi:hypothetical protein